MGVRDFNPRTREGCDRTLMGLLRRIVISIHAPVKGATTFDDAEFAASFISIHAPVKGATTPAIAGSAMAAISIHAPVKGATAEQAYDVLAS